MTPRFCFVLFFCACAEPFIIIMVIASSPHKRSNASPVFLFLCFNISVQPSVELGFSPPRPNICERFHHITNKAGRCQHAWVFRAIVRPGVVGGWGGGTPKKKPPPPERQSHPHIAPSVTMAVTRGRPRSQNSCAGAFIPARDVSPASPKPHSALLFHVGPF